MTADVIFNTGSVTRLIESGDWVGLEAAIREEKLPASEYIGMNLRLAELVKRGEIDAAEALRETSDIPGLRRRLPKGIT
jgi:hypothetical protein